MNDIGILFLLLAFGCFLLVVMGVMADWWDGHERRDAERRNRRG